MLVILAINLVFLERWFKQMKKNILLTISLLFLVAFFVYASVSEKLKTKKLDNIQKIEKETFSLINEYRKKKGLKVLVWDETIAKQSRLHSAKMAEKQKLSHDDFQARVNILLEKFDLLGAGENVAFNYNVKNPAKTAFEGWIKSKGHRENIEADYNLSAIGINKNKKQEYYFTQIFIKTKGDKK